ncbi:MAG: ABC transporter permease subunit [Streptococcaceae bacterium]|jgi:putative lysine transport system permease protein|nr:ABC transporter permease subunit [Streptococcaceae bacterium]
MKKTNAIFLVLSFLLCLFFISSTKASAQTSEQLRVGMEAAYAPFNWTQNDNSNGAVPIDGVSGQWANGYDVQVAKKLAAHLNKELVIVKSSWDGLLPALTSGRIDAIIAGMSPTEERRQQIDFTDSYYNSKLVLMVNKNGKFAQATSLADFKGAKVTAQLGTFHYDMITQIPQVSKQPASRDFSSMRVALLAGSIDAYVAEQPEGMTAENANPNFKMIQFADGKGFTLDPSQTMVSIGVRKNDENLASMNEWLATFTTADREALMKEMVKVQPEVGNESNKPWYEQVMEIIRVNGPQFLRGTQTTLLISLVGTIIGTFIGLLIGVFRTIPEITNKAFYWLHKIIGWIISAYIEIFRGTPMIVQAMVLYYGTALAFGINIDRMSAALFIVSINTGAYMSEIVRGGIYSVDKGQFEAAQAIGMTHAQTMRKVVLPQVMRNILPATGNEFVINIKDTSVLSVIAVTELFFQGTTVAQQNFMYFQTFAVICVIYFVLTFTITRILRFVERKMDGPDAYIAIQNQMQTQELEEN